MDPTVEQMIATFAQLQLHRTIDAGTGIGLAPVTVAATMMQVSASLLAQIAPAETVALMRAYADVIEAGPNATDTTRAETRSRFDAAAQAFIAVARATADFPQPQGRA